MVEQRTVKGFWWNPQSPSQRWFGVLEQNAERIELTCHSDTGDVGRLKNALFGTVHGLDEKGSPVTLLVATRVASTSHGGMETVRLHPAYVLAGIHVADRDSLRVKTLELRLQHLYGWLGMTGFNRKTDASPSCKIAIAYDRPEWIPQVVRPGLTVDFGLAVRHSLAGQSQSISEESAVCLAHETGFSFRECWEMSSAFRALIHLAILKPVYTVGMTLRDCSDPAPGTGASQREVVVWSENFREAKTEEPLEPFWVFRHRDFAEDFGAFFCRWLDYMERYSEALGCYTTTVYHRLPSTVRHLCLTQALDAYHGVRFGSHDEQAFLPKLQALFSLNADAMSGLVADIPAYVDQVVTTRNYYTHHNPKKLATGKVAKGSTLVRMNEVLQILLQACVLTEIGVPLDRLGRLRRQIASEIIEF